MTRLLEKIEIDPATECWVFTGAKNHAGYGWIGTGVGTQSGLAHRLAYENLIGPVTSETLDHLCRNRACCNPDHLEPVSHAENMRRTRGLRAPKTHCKNGHEFTEENTYAHPNGSKVCRTCTAESRRRYEQRAGVVA